MNCRGFYAMGTVSGVRIRQVRGTVYLGPNVPLLAVFLLTESVVFSVPRCQGPFSVARDRFDDSLTTERGILTRVPVKITYRSHFTLFNPRRRNRQLFS